MLTIAALIANIYIVKELKFGYQGGLAAVVALLVVAQVCCESCLALPAAITGTIAIRGVFFRIPIQFLV
jgi:hypothetical protein